MWTDGSVLQALIKRGREGGREGERDRGRERERETEAERDRARETGRERERHIETERQREKERKERASLTCVRNKVKKIMLLIRRRHTFLIRFLFQV